MSFAHIRRVWDAKLDLDPTALLVLLRLAHQADDNGTCWPSVNHLAERLGLARRTVQKALRRLEKVPVIKTIRGGRSADGNNRRSNFYLLNLPAAVQSSAKYPTGSDVRPESELDALDTVSQVRAQGESYAQESIIEQAIETTIEHDPTASSNSVTPSDIYEAYPRHVAKQAALKAIKKAHQSGKSLPWLLERVREYAEAVQKWPLKDHEYVPHPATWFNGGRYEDDPKEWIRGHEINGGTAPEITAWPPYDSSKPNATTRGVEVY